ncbi:MAG TPA: outer membrane beta-barrel protein [Methylomirabilota bacterium]|nr:outer membrane beta-barrel protein [Methylomirabilota bacterium]
MKKLIASASLLALGAIAVNAQGQANSQGEKPWSIGATLRGFYDDNINTSPDGFEQESFGAEVGPYAALNLFLDQTTLGLSYNYQMRWFEDRPNAGSADHSHQVNGKLSHTFSERLSFDLTDSFVIAQEPEVLAAPGSGIAFPLRAEGDNMRNSAQASLTAQMSEQLGLVFGYDNNWFDYENPGLSQLLDRFEHYGRINLRYTIVPETVGVIGYQAGLIDYTEDDAFVGITPAPGRVLRPSHRDRLSHYFYVGADHTFNPQLNASIRGGVEYADYFNALPGMRDDAINPYADGNITWTYLPGSTIQLGARHQRMATDVLGVGATVVQDAETTMVYGSWNHALTGKLRTSVLANYQWAQYDRVNFDDHILFAGAQISYDINEFLAAEAGYFFDKLDSDIVAAGVAREYTRNRVFVGLRANY